MSVDHRPSHATPAMPTPAGGANPSQAGAGAPIVVIGAGLAGWTTVRELRKLDSTTPIVVLTADSGDFYAKPSLSNALAQKRSPAQLVSTPAAKMAETLNVTLQAFTTVQRIDTGLRWLTLQRLGASHTQAYSQLVLATGAQAIQAPLAGNAMHQVGAVNSLSDFAHFHAQLLGPDGASEVQASGAAKKTVLVIGAGLIGCEFANDLLLAGHRVHVVDPSPRPLAALLPEQAGLQLQAALQAQGVQWHFGVTAQAVNAADAQQGAGGGVASAPLCITLADGQTIQADVVLSAIGLRADMALAQAAGIRCERGIVVDAQLRTSAADVYALGDAAQYLAAGQRTLPYVMPIMHAAKALAATLAGTPSDLVFPLMPVSVKTPALPIVVSPAHPSLAGEWLPDAGDGNAWRFVDSQGVQRGFALSGTSTARRMEFAKTTVL